MKVVRGWMKYVDMIDCFDCFEGSLVQILVVRYYSQCFCEKHEDNVQ